MSSTDTDVDYDMAAARAAGVEPDERGHYPDTYKLPTHPTFSDDSLYHNPINQGGHWERVQGTTNNNEWNFTPGPANLAHHSMDELRDYFKKYEPESHLLPPSPTPEQRAAGYAELRRRMIGIDPTGGSIYGPYDDSPTLQQRVRRAESGAPDIYDLQQQQEDMERRQREPQPAGARLPPMRPIQYRPSVTLQPIEHDPYAATLVPVDDDPFVGSVRGDVAGAGQRLQAAEAQRRATIGQLVQPFMVPGRVAQGVTPETSGVMTEADAYRLNQLQQEAEQFGPRQALSMAR